MNNNAHMPPGGIVLSVKAVAFFFLRRSAVALAAVLVLFALMPGQATAERGRRSLAGSWSGGGWVSFAGGPRERARCRVRYVPASRRRFRLSATCATESGRVSQTATVRKSGANSYAGSFYNSEYDVSGSIYITVRGNRQKATLRSSGGSAVLTLHR